MFVVKVTIYNGILQGQRQGSKNKENNNILSLFSEGSKDAIPPTPF